MKQKVQQLSDQELAQIVWDYMRLEQPLEKADMIIGMGSRDILTAKWCAKLYLDGLAPIIIFSGARGRITRHLTSENEADIYAKTAIGLGVPEEAIVKEDQATNSGENITFVYKKILELGITHDKILIVHKPYMLRRVFAALMRQWPDDVKPQIICSAVNLSFEEYLQDTLYPFDYVVNVMVGDLQRIREYPKRGFQIEQEIPDSVWGAYEELVRRGYVKHLLSDYVSEERESDDRNP